ncbi:ABC transporter ATP-binding protein [Alkalicaulis satelles]|uniref:ABC transporter ATP-binding protein n=1 Tax=Alkalicaulis satelles TaxID=2609175 RepID=A0A5M6ZG12_9PROT|nr:ABC transporter ATP-binding protein [Alkalicaulis satelles]KAA5803659.1 ABC transporter ATP-binding protein [Alkalicaulis satelles]
MILADALVKTFAGKTAVDRVSFQVRQGEVLGFLGPNGAGKSTTMRMIAGCLEPDGGRAAVAGFDSAMQRRQAQSQLGYLPEGAPAYPAMTPRGFVRFSLRARGFSGAGLEAAAELALARASLGAAAERPIGTLSKGYKRRAALAAAIAHDPLVLILDEPTDGLDPNQKDGVRALITAMAPDKAIIISTHLLDEVEAICTRAILIAGGRVMADETPGALAKLGPQGDLPSAFRALTAPSGEVISHRPGRRAT